ncbi:MAG: hypothetical protein J07HQW2_02521 [Haloquadratum walsbyi J07HQW2]|uniref:Amino acid transporter n=1 Tax=Haloquadratum walsbyi J07HQW2 TaxID=1238425 RepID=U1MZV3_9EURY|nr:MAG: hypothetical protein J07HQW2_02521 [Haloquadratum walsbyi J07HQW2]
MFTFLGTPYRAIGITGGLILLFIIIGDLTLLSGAASGIHLIIYGLLNLALIVMRYVNPKEYKPAFTVPLYPLVPILGIVFSFALLVFIAGDALLLSFGIATAAIVWYVLYARSRTEKRGILSKYITSHSEVMPDAAVNAVTSVQPDGGQYRVMVPLANPENEKDLIILASAIAKQRNGTVVATHIATVPDQTALSAAADRSDKMDETSKRLLDNARKDAKMFSAGMKTHAILLHKSYEAIFDAARTHGWSCRDGGGTRIHTAHRDGLNRS